MIRTTCSALLLILLTTPLSGQLSLLEQEQEAFKAAAAHIAPVVVQVQTFGGLDRVDETLTGTGPTTGLVFSSDGFIVTSAFAFAGKPAATIVTLADGKKLDAKIVATDFSRMLTLLKIEANDLPLAEPAPLAELEVGQWTLAVGKAIDFATPNVSPGVLSARNRIWGKAVQTDAKISPFNYGGPLIDLHGRVIGLIVPLSMTSDQTMAGVEWYDSGIGFAVPIDQVNASVERLKTGNDLYRGTLGITPENPGNLFAPPRTAEVREGGAGEKAGFQKGDLITAINDTPVKSTSEVMRQLGPFYAGDTVRVTMEREGEQSTLEITLEKPTQTSILPEQHPTLQPGDSEETPSPNSN